MSKKMPPLQKMPYKNPDWPPFSFWSFSICQHSAERIFPLWWHGKREHFGNFDIFRHFFGIHWSKADAHTWKLFLVKGRCIQGSRFRAGRSQNVSMISMTFHEFTWISFCKKNENHIPFCTGAMFGRFWQQIVSPYYNSGQRLTIKHAKRKKKSF